MRKHGTFIVTILYVAVILSGCFGNIMQNEDISKDAASKSESIPSASSQGGANNIDFSQLVGGKWTECDGLLFEGKPAHEENNFSNVFDGKSKTDYEYEANTNGTTLFWAEQVAYSPTKHYALFLSNRNCLKTQGMSIFLVDYDTGEESLLVDGSDNNYYSVIGWLPDGEHFVVQVLTGSSQNYQICNLTGQMQKIDMQYENPVIIALRGDVVVFSDRLDQNTVIHAQLNSDGFVSKQVSYTPANGFLMGECAISPDLKKVAFKVRTDYEHSQRYIVVWDTETKVETTLPDPDIENAIDIAAIDINWDTQYLCVNFNVTKTDGVETYVPLKWIIE